MNEEKNDKNLNVYCALFVQHKEKEWVACGGFIFAERQEDIPGLLEKKYGEVCVRSIKRIDVEAGTILYGERWRAIK